MQPDNKTTNEDSELLNKLRSYLENGLENPYGITGSVVWHIEESDSRSSWYLPVTLNPLKIGTWSQGTAPLGHTTIIRMPWDVAAMLVQNIHFADYRDPNLIGRLHFEGDLKPIPLIATGLLSPGPVNRQRLDWATSRDASGYKCHSIARIHQPTEIEVLQHIAAGQPFVATGLTPIPPVDDDDDTASGAAVDGWTLERLAAKFGHVPLRARSADWQETVGEFVQRLQNSFRNDRDIRTEPIVEGFTKLYTEGCALPDAMRSAFMPRCLTLDDYENPQIWLGVVPVNVPASRLHRDPLDGFLFQLMGRKKLILYSPDQAPLLYPLRAWSTYQPCWVDPESPRLDLFPEFAHARAIELILNPGELLIQPAGWFHAVYCLDSPTFSVSYFFRH